MSCLPEYTPRVALIGDIGPEVQSTSNTSSLGLCTFYARDPMGKMAFLGLASCTSMDRMFPFPFSPEKVKFMIAVVCLL